MVNIKMLKDEIADSGMPKAVIARRAGIVRETLQNRLAGIGEFKAGEIVKISKVLNLSNDKRDKIFLQE